MSSHERWIVCDSPHHQNTLRVAQAIGQAIGATVVEPEQVSANSLESGRILGMGSGIYFGAHSQKILDLAKNLPPGQRGLFLFSTAGLPWLCWFFHRRLRKIIQIKGGVIVGEFHCPGWDTFGPTALIGGLNRHHPNARDLQRATDFGRMLLDERRLER